METAFLFTSALLLIGLFLRARVRVLQVCYVPAAIIGGLLGLAVLQVGRSALVSGDWIPEQSALLVGEFRTWPGWLISVVFAGLFLDKPGRSLSENLGGAARQCIVVWIISLGQVAIGLLAVLLIIQPLGLGPFGGDVPVYVSQLIEAGFVGGHGTSAALGRVWERMGYPEAQDLAFFMATVGLIYSVVSGMVFVNLGVRRGWTRAGQVRESLVTGVETGSRDSIGLGRVSAEVLDPLVFQGLILGAAFAAGLALQALVGLVYDGLPLFMFTLLGGWLVRDAMRLLGIADLIDPDTVRRLVAAAMEFLIVAAIASLNLVVVAKAIVPLSVLLVVAFVWTGICLVYVGRRLLPPEHWFELGIINYGMSTGVTATGLMLLRIVDKDLDSGAAENYALGGALSFPFVGGGVLTFAAFPFMIQGLGVGITACILVAATLAMFGIGLVIARNRST